MAKEFVAPSTRHPARVFFHTKTPAALITAGFDSIRIERRQKTDVAWSTVTKSLKHPGLVLAADVYNYSFLDEETFPNIVAPDNTQASGGATVFAEYRAVLTNSVTPGTPADVPQSPVRGISTWFEQVMSIKEVKEIYLWGQDEGFIHGDGRFQPDYAFAHFLRYGIRKVERKLNIRILPELQVEKHDIMTIDFERDGDMLLSVDEFPFTDVFKIVTKTPKEADVELDLDYVSFDGDVGQVNIRPEAWQAAAGARPAMYRARKAMGLEITYMAGFDMMRKGVPDELKEAVGKEAAFGPLNVGGDLIGGAGLAGISLSMDGLSQNVTTTNSSTNAGFGARLIQYEKELKEMYSTLRPFYKGVGMRVC
jgi:hypothetical protein